MKRTLAIWLPNWPLQRLIRKQPELRERPVVLESRGPRGACVAACSDEASQLGIDVGMPLAEALALGKKIAGWHKQQYDPLADREALVRLAGWCYRFSPCVGLEDVTLPDQCEPETLLLDVTNLAPLFGGESALAEQVADSFHRLQLDARIALADNIAVAWAVTHYGRRDEACMVIPAGAGRQTVEPLPIAALRLPGTVQETLQQLGVFQAGDLLALPRDQLRSRFGAALLERIDQALGQVAEVIESAPPPPDWTVSKHLEHPLARRAAIERVVEQLIERLAHLLSAQNAGALQLTCRFDCQEGPPARVEAGLFRPSCHPQHLLEIMQMRLECLLLTHPVTAVSVSVTRHGPLERRQQVLFESESPLESSWELAALVDRLAGRLGREAVFRCRLVAEAQPELAYREQPLVGSKKIKQATSRTARRPVRTNLAPLDRPLQLLEQPARVEALTVAGGHPPEQFFYHGRRHDVTRHWGPERIETGWWRKRGILRDYYRVETAAGQRFWLYRCLRTRDWFLHGIY
ncbi:DNA polymerase Y family protein [Pirellulales bacterium]|nr:DNA polymerase Y family protein [Pirellulales bacterium]